MVQIKARQPSERQHSTQLLSVNSESQSENLLRRQPIDLQFIEKFYHEGTYEFSEPEIEYNEVSPSQFNIENQRFDEEALKDHSSVLADDPASSTPLKQFHADQLKKDFD